MVCLTGAGCGGNKYDIVFIYEDTWRMTNQSFKDQMNFFKELASSINVGVDAAQIAIIKASGRYTPGEVIYHLPTHATSRDVISAIDNIRFMYTHHNNSPIYQFGYAVKSALENVFPYKRLGSKFVIIAVTADFSAHYQLGWGPLRNLSMDTQKSGVTLLVAGLDVAVDNLVDGNYHGIQLNNSGELQGIVPRFLRILCNGKSQGFEGT